MLPATNDRDFWPRIIPERQTTMGKYPPDLRLTKRELIDRRILMSQINIYQAQQKLLKQLNCGNQEPSSIPLCLCRLMIQSALYSREVGILQEIDIDAQEWTNESVDDYLLQNENISEMKRRINRIRNAMFPYTLPE